MKKILQFLLFGVVGLTFLGTTAEAQVNAASCSNTDVQNAINSAASGQTVNIPAGNCSWTNVTLAKAITLSGAGQGTTTINLSSSTTVLKITKQTSGVTRIKNLTLTATNNMNTPHIVTVSGPWPTGKPVIFQNMGITLNNADFVTILTPGGVIFSHITFNGTWGSTLLTGKENVNGNTSWSTPDTMGAKDTTGYANIYVEDSTFNGGTITDCDDGCRIVVRHNVGKNSGGFNSHGKDTSPLGMRHFEIYNNSFTFPDKTCPGGSTTSSSNINQWIWIRGGTGVIYSNNFDPLVSSCWGTKPAWKFAIRGAEDAKPAGSCSATTYAVSHQLGQNNNGSNDYVDPIYVWNNVSNNTSLLSSGFQIAVSTGWEWGNPCGFNWNTFFQWGRDAVNTTIGSSLLPTAGGNVDGIGGSAKPGYSAYAYPHPLAGGSTTSTNVAPPTGLAATVQ